MSVLFSNEFNIPEETLKDLGVFNVFWMRIAISLSTSNAYRFQTHQSFLMDMRK